MEVNHKLLFAGKLLDSCDAKTILVTTDANGELIVLECRKRLADVLCAYSDTYDEPNCQQKIYRIKQEGTITNYFNH